MVRQHKSFAEMGEMEQDHMMQQRASEWIRDCKVWHCSRVTDRIREALPENIGVWFVIADAQPHQSIGLLLSASPEHWEVLADTTIHKLDRSPETRQVLLELLLPKLQYSMGALLPLWRSDQREL